MPKEYGWSDDFVLASSDFKRWFKVVAGGYVYIGGMSASRKAKTLASLATMKAAGNADTVPAKSYEKALSGALMSTEEALFWAATAMARKKRASDPAWYKKVTEKFGKKVRPAAPGAPGVPAVAVPFTKRIKPIYVIVPAAIGLVGIIAIMFLRKR